MRWNAQNTNLQKQTKMAKKANSATLILLEFEPKFSTKVSSKGKGDILLSSKLPQRNMESGILLFVFGIFLAGSSMGQSVELRKFANKKVRVNKKGSLESTFGRELNLHTFGHWRSC